VLDITINYKDEITKKKYKTKERLEIYNNKVLIKAAT